MKVSFEGIGQWSATFACGDGVKAGQMVKISGNGEVSGCAAGDGFCGMAGVVGRDGAACSVVLGGMVTAACGGTMPALGWSSLSADGKGGIKADGAGQKYLVAAVDEAAKTVTFVL